MTPHSSPSYFTICARNYLAYALTLRQSLLAAQPGARFFIFLADAPLDEAHRQRIAAPDIIDLAALDLPDQDDMAFRYDVLEFSTAIKPYCFRYLFDKEATGAAVYLDPDIFVTAPLTHVEAALADGVSAVLTPHMTRPLPDDGFSPTTLEVHRSGVFNLGFAALANTPEATEFIDWWAARCAKECINDPARGLFVDQKFVDWAPAFVENLTVLHHPGYNAAYWNLHERTITHEAEKNGEVSGWRANGEPLSFFHFSGVAPGNEAVFSKHQNRFSPVTIGDLRGLLTTYLDQLAANHHEYWRNVPYAYGFFDDGVAIPRGARRLSAVDRDGAHHNPIPFRPSYHVCNAPCPHVEKTIGAPITALMYEIWRTRDDLQEAFPLTTGSGRRGYHRWFLLNAERELHLDDVFVEPARRGLASAVAMAARIWRGLPDERREKIKSSGVSNS